MSVFNNSTTSFKRVIYTPEMSEKGENLIRAFDIEVGDAIMLGDDLFWIDDIDSFFINDEISKLYEDDDESIECGHSKHTFYDNKENEICEIPDEALFHVWRKVEGNLSNI